MDKTTNNVFTTTLGYDNWSRHITTIYQRGSDTAKQFGQRYNDMGYLSLVEREFGSPGSQQAQILWQPTQQDASNRVIQAQLGNGLVDNRCYDAGTGYLADSMQDTSSNATVCGNVPSAIALQEAYTYDKLGNVSSRTQAWNAGITGGTLVSSSYSESFTYDGLNRLYTSTVVGGTEQSFTYGPGGNLTSKTGNGNYHYLTNGVIQPHAVSAIDNIAGSFSYDANGNQLGGNGRTTTWNSFDMPATIARGGNSSTFAYGPDHERTSQAENNAGVQSMVYYGGAQEVQLDGNNNLLSVKTYWPNGLGVEIDKPGRSATELDWTHEDRLGSIVAITDVNGNLKEAMGFDAWGSRRLPGGITAVTPTSTQVTESTDDKGFTGQEMLDPLELVHLNGRVYDPLVGKFVSGDPHVTDPLNGQNYNRYSYVLNNPTNDTDPTGFDTGTNIEHSQMAPLFLSCSGNCGGAGAPMVVPLADGTVTISTGRDGRVIVSIAMNNGAPPVSQTPAAGKGDAAQPASANSSLPSGQTIMQKIVAYDLPTISPKVYDFSAGLGDEFLLGQGGRLRDWLDIGSINTASGSYTAGKVTGAVALVALGTGVGAEAAGTAEGGMEFSHALPARYFRELSLSGKSVNAEYKPLLDKLFGWGKDTILNGNYRTAAEHYLEDPFRYPAGWRELGPRYPDVMQMLSRIPNVFKGMAGGGVAAGAGAAAAPGTNNGQ